jgi:hypothetical protein
MAEDNAPQAAAPKTAGEIQAQIEREAKAMILAIGGPSSPWPQDRHAIFLARVIGNELGLSKEQRLAIVPLLAFQGMGGNASQFQQWLRKPAPKGPGLLSEKAAASLAAYEGIE